MNKCEHALLPKLSPKMRLVAAKLATGVSARQTAQELGIVSYQTISRWQQIPEFQTYLKERLDLHDSEADALLKSLRLRAIQRLADLLENENPHISLRASEAVLDRQKMIATNFNDIRQDSNSPINVGSIMKSLGIRYEH